MDSRKGLLLKRHKIIIHHAGKCRNRFFPVILFPAFFFPPNREDPVFEGGTDYFVTYPENVLQPFTRGPEEEPCLGPILGPGLGWFE